MWYEKLGELGRSPRREVCVYNTYLAAALIGLLFSKDLSEGRRKPQSYLEKSITQGFPQRQYSGHILIYSFKLFS